MSLKSLFPLKGHISQEIIDKANIADTKNCIGALALKEALGNSVSDNKVEWGSCNGYINYGIPNKVMIIVGTEDDVRMMRVKEPRDVMFILVDDENTE